MPGSAPSQQASGGVQERAREINRLQKVLEGANIKLASVASSIVVRRARLWRLVCLTGRNRRS